MVHELTGQARLIVSDKRDAIIPGNIFRRHDHKLVPGDAGVERNFLDSAAGNLAANRRAMEHIRQEHVVDVQSFSVSLLASFLARNRRADDALMVHVNVAQSPGLFYMLRWDSVYDNSNAVTRSSKPEIEQPISSIAPALYRSVARHSRPIGSPGSLPSRNTGFPLK